MIVHLTTDEAAIRSAVGRDTFLRGRSYALAGAAQQVHWVEAGRVARGEVLGTASRPYVATAVVSRDADGAVTAFIGTCTCPVGVNCKHIVAVALRALDPDIAQPTSSRTGPAQRTDPALAGWEETLDALTRQAHVETAATAQVALQFEVVPGPTGAPQSVSLRPVVPGRNGGWVRTGISWSNLTALQYSRQSGVAKHARLLNELSAMHAGTVSPQHFLYGYREPRMMLEDFVTRRVWDLLDEMRAAALPFVQAGRSPAAVVAHEVAASATFDLTRTDVGVTVTPRVVLDGEVTVPNESLLLGAPAHGVAWFEAGALHLARLSAAAGVDIAALLATPALTVPDDGHARLLADYVPRLRRIAPVVSRDASVEVPEAQPPALALHVAHRADHRVAVTWNWIYAAGAARHTEPLWPDVGPAGVARDATLERQIARPTLEVARGLPVLFDDGRLAPEKELSGMATVAFVNEILPALRLLGGVEVAVDGEPADYREVDDEPVITFVGVQEERDWFDLAVTVTVAGEEVPFLELFQALAGGAECLILPSGTYFALDRPEFAQLARMIEESRALLDAPPGTVRVGRLQAGVWDELDRLGVVTAQAEAWRELARTLSAVERIDEQPVPSGLQAELRSYQLDGFNWLAFLFEHGLGGVLADEMGLGKTLQTLALMCHVREKGLADAPFLVIAPTSVVHNWAGECARFAPNLAVRTITETGRRREQGLAEIAAGADVVVTSYTLFRLEHDDYAGLAWAGLVLDEAQFVKNHQSRAYECAKTLDVAFKLAVTGTPLENNMMELWSLLSITAAGLFPKPRPFEEYYRWPVERGHDAERLDQLRRRIRPLMLRRTKQQVIADLPDKQEQVVELDLNPRHRKIYQTYLQRERQKVLGLLGEPEKNRFAIFRSLTLLRQACLAPGLVDPVHASVPSTKLDALLDQLTELAADGHRAVVFSQFTRFLAAARTRLDAAGIEYCYLDGKTTRRAEVVDRFKTGAAPVFLISLKAGGFGLTLTEADYCFLLDPWWNPATEAQAVDRLHRIGQSRKVMVYRMVARETIEEKVMALKVGKAALFDSIMDARGVTSGKLTAADIRGLLA